jgi:hypothetical protein
MAEQKQQIVQFAFKAAQDNNLVWPCQVRVPLSGGGHQMQELKARFKVIEEGRYRLFYPTAETLLQQVGAIAAGRAAPDDEAMPARLGDEGLLDEVLQGVVDVPGGEGMSAAELTVKLRSVPYIKDGLIAGYHEMIGRRVPKN